MQLPRRTAVAAVTLSFAVTLGGCGSPGSSASAPAAATTVDGIQHLGVAAFAALAAAPSTVVLDVRTPEEFATGHLTGARLVDFRGADFDARIAGLDRTATHAVYCHSGNRSGQALERMKAAGFTHVADLSGGISAWSAAGQPVTKS